MVRQGKRPFEFSACSWLTSLQQFPCHKPLGLAPWHVFKKNSATFVSMWQVTPKIPWGPGWPTGDGIRPAPNRNLIIMCLNMCIPQSSLEVDLNAMEMSKSQALQIADAQKCTMREQLLDEMAGYKVKYMHASQDVQVYSNIHVFKHL